MADFTNILAKNGMFAPAVRDSRGFAGPVKMDLSPSPVMPGAASPAPVAAVPETEMDTTNRVTGKAVGQLSAEMARKGPGGKNVPIFNERGRQVGYERPKITGMKMSPADWAKGPGQAVAAEMQGANPVEKMAIGQRMRVDEDMRKAQGTSVSEFYRNRNADGTEKSLADRVAPTGIAGLKPLQKSSVDARGNAVATATDPNAGVRAMAQGSRQSGGDGVTMGRVVNREQAPAAPISTIAGQNASGTNTVAVAPQYAGPGQLTTSGKVAPNADGSVPQMNLTRPRPAGYVQGEGAPEGKYAAPIKVAADPAKTKLPKI